VRLTKVRTGDPGVLLPGLSKIYLLKQDMTSKMLLKYG
jgi:hypothetical protein